MPATRSRRLALVAVVAVAILTVAGACDPEPGATPPAPSGAAPAQSTDYAIALKDADGHVVRWNPCQPVRYVVNLNHAPTFAVAELQRAAAQIESATGIDLQYAGTTTEGPTARPLRNTSRYGAGFSPILVSFNTVTEFPFGDPTASGFGIGKTQVDSAGHRQYVTGLVVLRPNGWTEGHTSTNPLSLMLMHELGHVMGLAHSPTIHEIMGAGGNGTVRAWGAGDLVGLGKVGRPAGCLPTIA